MKKILKYETVEKITTCFEKLTGTSVSVKIIPKGKKMNHHLSKQIIAVFMLLGLG